jgi:hypothetical protein
MKKNYIILSIILLFSILFIIRLNLIQAQEDAPNLPFTPDDIDKIGNAPDAAKSRWEYLQTEWKTILLKNKFISSINSFFTKISIVFKLLFGMDWVFPSLLLFTVVILWIFFLINFSSIIDTFSTFSHWISYAIGFLIVIIMTHTQVLSKIATFFINVLSSERVGYSWLRTILYFLFLIILVLLSSAMEKYKKYIKETKEKAEEEAAKTEIKTTAKVAKEINKGFKNS